LWLNIKKQLLQGTVGDFVKLKIIEISSRSGFDVEEIEVDKDHIHILLTISPTICVASYVCRIRQSTTENLWRKFGWLKSNFGSKKPFSLTDTLSI
jgi:putative transposase